MRKTIAFDPRWFETLELAEARWPDFGEEADPKEPAASVFTIRLSRRDRERLEEIQAKLGLATLNQTVQSIIRLAHRVYVED
jgi:hypothetical protein